MTEFNMKTDDFIRAIKNWRDLDLLEKLIKFSGFLFGFTGCAITITFWILVFSGKFFSHEDLICVEAKAKGYQLEQCEPKP